MLPLLCGLSFIQLGGEAHNAPEHKLGGSAAPPEFERLRAKELRHLLWERGVECPGCTEKQELVAKVRESYDLPVSDTAVRATGADRDQDTSYASQDLSGVMEGVAGLGGDMKSGFGGLSSAGLSGGTAPRVETGTGLRAQRQDFGDAEEEEETDDDDYI